MAIDTGIVAAAAGAQAPVITATVTTPNAKRGATKSPKFIRPNFERMPSELKFLKNWVLWGAVWTGSKWTKRPIQVSGYGASTANLKHWSSFDDVKQAYERAVQRGYIELREKSKPIQQIPVGGVGFVFDGRPDEDGLVFAGVDFDSGAFKGKISSFSAERVKRLGSYVEASVSGTGVHVIVKAHPLDSGIAHNGIEMYTGGRFFTMTGRTGSDAQPIIAAPDAFAKLAEELRTQSASSRTGEGDLPNAVPESGVQTAEGPLFGRFWGNNGQIGILACDSLSANDPKRT